MPSYIGLQHITDTINDDITINSIRMEVRFDGIIIVLLQFVTVDDQRAISDLIITELLIIRSKRDSRCNGLRTEFRHFMVADLDSHRLRYPRVSRSLGLVGLVIRDDGISNLIFKSHHLSGLLAKGLKHVLGFFGDIRHIDTSPLLTWRHIEGGTIRVEL